MITSEGLLIKALSARLGGVKAFADIPRDRPERFVTVERVGGQVGPVVDSPRFAVQAWAPSRAEAAALMEGPVCEALRGCADEPWVGRIEVESVYNFPDPDSEHPRYQATVNAVTYPNSAAK